MVWDRVDSGHGDPDGRGGSVAGPSLLGEQDVGDMLALVAEAQPGPFLPRTVEFGGYVGIRRRRPARGHGRRAPAPPGYAEISAVATDPGHRRQGLGELLVRARRGLGAAPG